jgi:hypothetical protein
MSTAFPAPALALILPCMPRQKKDPELKWAEQQRFENVAAALRRILAKLPCQKG